MAKQLNVNLAFTADTSQAAAQVRNLQQQLTSLINQPVGIGEKLTPGIQAAANAAAELKVHLQNATNVKTGTLDFGRLNQSLKASGQSLSQYAAKLQSLGPQGQQAFMSLARSVASAEVPLRRSNALLTQFTTTLANTARWQLSSSLLHGFISSVSTAWRYSQDLNESLNNIRIVTGKNIDEMSRFADQANRAAKALSTTTTAYTNASLIYYQQGLSDAEVLGRTETTIKMANASRQSAEIVSDQMTAIWNNFYDGSKSLEYYADVVTALGAATASSSEEIAQGLEKFAAVAETVGLSYEYATAALTTITATTRQSADIVGTALKTLFARLSDLKLGETLEDGTTLGQYSENLAKIGVNIKDTSGNLKDMDTILNETAAKWDNLSKAQQVALAKGVAGIRQYTQFIALMDNWDFMEENLNTATNATGALSQQAKIYEESWQAASDRVKASLETIYASIMDDEFFIELTDGFAKLIDDIGNFVKSIGGLQGVLSGLGWILTKVFAEQMTQGFQNLAYNIQMSTKAGRQAVREARDLEMQNFANQAVNYDTATKAGLTMNKVYKEEILMQQQLVANSDHLTQAEMDKAKILLEQKRIMGEQSIELARQLDKVKEISSTNRIELMGHGLNNGKSMSSVTSTFNQADVQARTMGNIELQLKSIGKTTQLTEVDFQKLEQRLKSLNAIDGAVVDDLISDLKEAMVSGRGLENVISQISAQMQKSTLATTEQVAALLGIDKGTPQYQKLKAKIEEYILKVREGKVIQDQHNTSLKNGERIVEDFGGAVGDSEQKVESMSASLTSMISGLMSLGMLVSSIQGLIDAIEDPDASGWEQFGRVLTSVAMIGMSLLGTFNLIKSSITLIKSLTSAETIAKIANAAATIAQVEAERQLNKEKGTSAKTTRKSIKQTWNDTALKKNKDFTLITDKKDTHYGQYQLNPEKYGKNVYASKDVAGQMAGKDALSALGKTVGRFGAAAAAIAIVAVTISVATAQFNKHTQAVKDATEQAKQAATAYDSVAQAQADFNSKVESYKNAQDGLKKLVKGTEEYEEAVLKANEETLKLLNTYKNLQYTIDDDGLIILDEDSLAEVKKLQLEQLKNAQMASLAAEQNLKDKKIAAQSVDFQRQKLQSSNSENTADVAHNSLIAGGAGAAAGALAAFAIANSWNPAGWVAAIVGGIGALIGGIITANNTSNNEEAMALNKLANEYAKNGNQNFTRENFDDLLERLRITDPELIASLKANREATLELVKEMALNNKQRDDAAASRIKEEYGSKMAGYGASETEVDAISHIVGSQMDTRIAQIYEDKYKDAWGNLTDAEVQKAYAKEMGWSVDTIDNQSGNKAKYYKEDGTEVGVISDDVARRYLAEKAAYEEAGKAIQNVTRKFIELSSSQDKAKQALASFIKQGDFSDMTASEYDKLKTSVDTDNNGATLDEVKTYINNIFGGADKVAQQAQAYGFENAEAFYEAFLVGFNSYQADKDSAITSITEKSKNLLMEAMGQAFNELSANDIKQAGSLIDNVTSKMGDEAGALIATILGRAGEEAGDLAIALNKIDWDTASVDSVAKAMGDAGVVATYSVDELQGLIDTMKEVNKQDFSLTQWLTDLKEFKKLTQGDIINEEAFKKLPTELQSYFTLMSDGTYKLTQDALDFYQLVNGGSFIEQQIQTKDELRDRLQKVTKNKEAIQKNDFYNTVNDKWDQAYSDWQTRTGLTATRTYKPNTHETYVRTLTPDAETGKVAVTGTTYDSSSTAWATSLINFVTGDGWNTKVSESTKIEDVGTSKAKIRGEEYGADEEYIARQQIAFLKETSWGEANAATIEAWESAANISAETAYEVGKVIEENGERLLKETEGVISAAEQDIINGYKNLIENAKTSAKREAYYQQAVKEGFEDQVKNSYEQAQLSAINTEAFENLDMEKLDSYSQYVAETFNLAEEQAEEVARATMKANRGLKELSDNFSKWKKQLDDSADGTEHEWEALNSIKTALSDLLDVSEEFIDNDFITKHLEEIGRAARGDKEAIEDLGTALGKDFILDKIDALSDEKKLQFTYDDVTGNDAINRFKAQLDKVTELVDNMDPMNIGKKFAIDEEGIAKELAKVVEAVGMSVEEANAYYRMMGFTPVYEEVDVPASQGTVTVKRIDGKRTDNKDGSYTIYETVTEEEIGISDAKTQLPTMQIQTADGKKAAKDITPETKVKQKSTKPSHLIYNGGSSNVSKSTDTSGGGKSRKNDKERYHVVDKQLNATRKAYEEVAKAKDRAFGADKLSLIEDEIALLDKELELLEGENGKLEQIKKNLYEVDKPALEAYAATLLGPETKIEFDPETGAILNYDAIMDAAIAKADSGEWSPEEYDAFLKILKQYEDTYELLINESANAAEKARQKFDLKLEKVQVNLELKTGVLDDQLEFIKYQLKNIEDSAYGAADALALVSQSAQATKEKADATKNAIKEMLENHGITDMNAFLADPEAWDDYDFTATEIEKLRTWRSELLNANQELMALKDQAIQKTIEAFDEWNSKMDKNIAKFNHYGNVMNSFKNIIDLVGKDTLGISDSTMKALTQAGVDNANNKLGASKAKLDALKSSEEETRKRLEEARKNGNETEVEALEKTLEHIEEQTQAAEEEMMGNWEAALQAAADAFDQAVDSTISSFEKAMAGTFGSLEDLQEGFNQATEISDRYVADYKEIYELSKLNRDIAKSMDDTDNIKGKKALKELQKEINDLQNSNVKMSQYDLDHLRKKYDLRMAEIALEEAQDAKSQVRMRRDSEGNYSYVFTADQSKIDEAQQNYEDKLYEMQELNSEYIKEMQNNILQSEIELANALRELDRTKFASDEEYYKKVNEITQYYTGQRNYYLDETNKGIENNQELVNDDWANYSATTGYKMSADEDYVDSFKETTYAQLAGYQSIEDAQVRFAKATETMVNDLVSAFSTWEENMSTAMKEAGTSVDGFGDKMNETVYGDGEKNKGIVGASDDAKQSVIDIATEMGKTFNEDTLNKLSEFATEYEKNIKPMITANEALVKTLNDIIAKQALLDGTGVEDNNNPPPEDNPPGEDPPDEENPPPEENPYGKASNENSSIKSIQWALWKLNYLNSEDDVDGIKGPKTTQAIKEFQKAAGISVDGIVGPNTRKAFAKQGFKTGGLVDYTGLAWLDGTPHKPEYVLNAQQTQGFLRLINLLESNYLEQIQKASDLSYLAIDRISHLIDLNAGAHQIGLGRLDASNRIDNTQVIEQEVTIHAEFPNATNHSEIEEAFNTLINRASQFANRKNI